MRILLKKAYHLLWGLFVLALIYSFWGRTILPRQLRPYGDPASFTIISLFVVINALLLYHHHFRFRDLKMESVDIMEGEKFEEFCAYLLKRNGFKRIQLTQASGDQGIDILHKKKASHSAFNVSDTLALLGIRRFRKFGQGIIIINLIKLRSSPTVSFPTRRLP